METTNNNMEKRNGILYPMMLIAAIAVIIFSVLGIATMTGLIPSARSGGPAQGAESAAGNRQSSATAKTARSPLAASSSADCADCDVVESIRAVENKGQGSGLDAIAP